MSWTPQTDIDAGLLQAVKDYLRITDTVQDAHIAALITAAEASVRAYLGTAIVAETVTESVQVGRNEGALLLMNRPVSAVTAITDPDGVVVSPDALLLMGESGMLVTGTGVEGRRYLLKPGVWSVTYTGGLSLRPDYATIANNVETATMLCVADLYSNRNPRAIAERDGDVSVSLGTPAYFDYLLGPYRRR